MITLPEHLEKQLITIAHRKNATTDKVLEWALKSLEFDLDDIDLADQVLNDIATGKSATVPFAQVIKDDLGN